MLDENEVTKIMEIDKPTVAEENNIKKLEVFMEALASWKPKTAEENNMKNLEAYLDRNKPKDG